MAWDSLFSGVGDLFTGDRDFGDSWFGGGSNWSNWFDNDTFDWSDLSWDELGFGSGGSSGGSNSGGSDLLGSIGKFLGGDNGEGSIFGKMLAGGLGGMAQSLIDEKTVKEAGRQQRQTYSFQAELQDFYRQKDKARKRAALDTFGQFSLLDRWAPNAQQAPAVEVPTKPKA